MSIYFSPSSPISVSDLLDGRLNQYGMRVHQLPHEPNRYQVTDGQNSIFLDANDEGAHSITDMTRYAGNEIDSIIEALQEAYNVVVYSEYEPQYWGGTCPWDMDGETDANQQDDPEAG